MKVAPESPEQERRAHIGGDRIRRDMRFGIKVVPRMISSFSRAFFYILPAAAEPGGR